MKTKIILFVLLFINYNFYSQNTNIESPKVKGTYENWIEGTVDKDGLFLNVDTDNDNKADYYSPIVNKEFLLRFTKTLPINSNITVWVTDKKSNSSKKNQYKVIPDVPEAMVVDTLEMYYKEKIAMLEKLLTKQNYEAKYVVDLAEGTDNKSSKAALSKEASSYLNLKIKQSQLQNTTLKYNATILNTNFSIPLARFNFTKSDSIHSKNGDLILFNSIGAGFGICRGQLERTRDAEGKVINEEFSNRFGAHIGFLFSAGTGEDTKNVFAPIINLSVLDFQVGFGYELGTVSESQKRTFITLSYAIPLYKLKKSGYWLLNKPVLVDDTEGNSLSGAE